MQNIFIEFLPPWVETGLQPAFYDKESGTVLQQVARMYAKMQEVVKAFDDFSKDTADVVNHYIEEFRTLSSYVHDYFDNLDVQEEINNKIDEMVESGEFSDIVANYLVIVGGNAKFLGCAGDGVTDDTDAINGAIDTLVASGTRKLVFPIGTYVVSGQIDVPSDFTIECMPGAVIKFVGLGNTGDIFHIYGDSGLAPVENVTLLNVNIDGTSQGYKGGASDATPLVTSTTPKYKGLTAIHVMYGKRIVIRGCNIKDVYGNGIVFSRSCIIDIDNNYLKDCSGGNPREGGDSGWDNFGDGITCFGCWNATMNNNTIINTRVYQASSTASDIGKICGRSGVEYEYPVNQDSLNAPDITLFNTTEGQGLRCLNNFIYGYTKGAHFETDVKVQFNNNSVIKCNLGCLFSVDGESEACNNYFNDDTAGTAIQGGYDAYSGAIILTNYGSNVTRKFVISGNIIHSNNNAGVSIAKDDVVVNGNYFYSCGVYTVASPSNRCIVTNNNFYDSGIYCYNNQEWLIDSNTFNCPTTYTVRISGGKKHKITNNNIDNTIYIEGNSEDIIIEGNTFETKSSIETLYNNNAFIYTYQTYIVVKDNIFNMVNNNTCLAWFSSSTANKADVIGNTFRLNTARTVEAIKFNSTANNVTILNNRAYGVGNQLHLVQHSWNATNTNIQNNFIDNQFAYIYYQSSGTTRGLNKISQNIGGLRFASTPNDQTDRFNGYWLTQGDVIGNYTTNSSMGWKVTRGGIYTESSYSDQSYSVGAYTKNGDYVYKCIVGGSATVAPTGTTTGNTETGSDNVTWMCCGKVATISAL